MFKEITPEALRQAIHEIHAKAANTNSDTVKIAVYQTGLITIAALLKDVKNV